MYRVIIIYLFPGRLVNRKVQKKNRRKKDFERNNGISFKSLIKKLLNQPSLPTPSFLSFPRLPTLTSLVSIKGYEKLYTAVSLVMVSKIS